VLSIFIKISLIIHVVAGSLSLLFGLLAILLKTKTPIHKKVGKVYFWCMTVIFITGCYLSIFSGNLFLFYISIFSYYLTISAYRALRYKKAIPVKKIDWLIDIISGLTFIGLIIFSILIFIKNNDKAIGIIPLVFGTIGLLSVLRSMYRYKRGMGKVPLEWLKLHIGNMIGSYIAAITAFLVNQSQYFPVHPTILWLGPTFALVPLIVIEIRKVKAKVKAIKV
jgi:hypothetical protein